MRKYIEDAVEELDAAVFTGDAFYDSEHRIYLRDSMARLERGLVEIEKSIDDSEGEES